MRKSVRQRLLAGPVTGLVFALALAGCGGDDDSSPTAPTATVAATAAATATATRTSAPRPTATASSVPTSTSSPTQTTTPTASDTPTPTPTATPTVSSTATPTATPETCDDPAVQAREPLCALDEATTPCEFLIAEKCLLPYPSSYFLTAGTSAATGLRVNYTREALPANVHGVHIDPTEWNTLDGFSPGPLIQALFPQGVDLAASGTPPITDLARSLAPDSPTVIVDAETGARVPHFAELDAQASSPAVQAFLIRPAVRLRDATRYIVAIRGLRGLNGELIPAERPFAILRDQLATPVRAIEARRAHFEDIFDVLSDAGVARGSLILAWDFVTASTESLTGRALSLRDQGLAANGDGAPPYTITSIDNEYSDNVLTRIRGTFTVPLFMTSATPPARYSLDAQGVPVQNGTAQAPFTVTVPRAAVAGGVAHPARPLVYGHGLLGTGEGEVTAGHLQAFSNRFNFVVAATDWIGMSTSDLPTILGFIPELSGFPALPDRLQQATLNFILLGRLLTAPDGLLADPALQLDGVPLVDPQELYFYGISQGGIAGGTYMAMTPDHVRGVLGVGAVNYSLLLQRSLDFDSFQALLAPNYPDELDRQLLLGLIQQLWDRADPQGYLPHLVDDPLPGTPAKKVLMQIGVHDSQVATVGSEVQARSLGLPVVAPSAHPAFGITERAAPFDGSAYIPYDVNAVPAPLTNTSPADDNGVHEAVRRLDAAQRQIDAFLRPDGRVENFCPGPCFFTNVPNVEER